MNNHLLYYREPAKHYMEALPLGNGSLGAMCYSLTDTDIISLNHDTMWTGHPRTVKKEGAYESYQRAQKQALAGAYRQAQEDTARMRLCLHAKCKVRKPTFLRC